MLNKLKVRQEVIFKFKSCEYVYEVREYTHGYYLYIYSNEHVIFEKLKIVNISNYIKNIYGYGVNVENKMWPDAKSLEDLLKLVNKIYELIETYDN